MPVVQSKPLQAQCPMPADCYATSGGVILMELEKTEKLLAAQAIRQEGVIVSGTGHGGKVQEIALSVAVLGVSANGHERQDTGVQDQGTVLIAVA